MTKTPKAARLAGARRLWYRESRAEGGRGRVLRVAYEAPQAPERELGLWYQYYFHSERGRAGLALNRYELGKLLWRLWSPSWRFDEAVYRRTAASFDNPDFVAVVIHSCRHRFGLAPGDLAVEDTERRLAAQPPIAVSTITLHGRDNGVLPPATSERHARHFTGPYERRVLDGVGHNLPLEASRPVADAVLALIRGDRGRRNAPRRAHA